MSWSQSTGGYVYASPAVWNETILIGSYSGRFSALDAATGDEWEFDAGGPISGSATVLGERRLLLDAEGPDLRARRGDRQAGLELPRRQVLADRRGAGPRVPDRVHEAVRPRSKVGLPRDEPAAPPPDLDAEQEVDFGRYWRLIAQRWWLPVIGLVAGLVDRLPRLARDALVDLQGDRARLPRPAARAGRRRARLERADDARARLEPRRERGDCACRRRQVGPQGRPPERAHHDEARARDHRREGRHAGAAARDHGHRLAAAQDRRGCERLAEKAVESVSGYPNVKIAKLKEQIDFDDQSIARNNDRFANAQREQQAILADKSLSPTEKLLLLANINTTLVTVEQRLGQLETDRRPRSSFSRSPRTSRRRASARRPSRSRQPGRTAAPAPRSAA